MNTMPPELETAYRNHMAAAQVDLDRAGVDTIGFRSGTYPTVVSTYALRAAAHIAFARELREESTAIFDRTGTPVIAIADARAW